MDPCSSVRGNRADVAGSYGARLRTIVTHWCDNTARAETDVRPEDSAHTFHALPYEKNSLPDTF